MLRADQLQWCLQENTVVQTCVVACSSLAFSGGFGCYLLSMDGQTFRNLGSLAGNRPQVGCFFHPLVDGRPGVPQPGLPGWQPAAGGCVLFSPFGVDVLNQPIACLMHALS